jgi:isopenicillin N synthase-like dioxygenase
MAEAADIAVVSFDSFINGSDADRQAVAKKVYDAFSSVGWVYISEHGIPQSRIDEVFDIVRASPIHTRCKRTYTA